MDFSGIVPALPSLWEGMLMTLKLMVLGVLGGVALGTVLALMRLSHSKLLSNIAGFYVNYFRSIPLLLVITWFYFAVPFILRWITGEDTPVGAFTSCLVAFMMFEAAYYCEIVRAGIQAIPKGQMGAAQALGMTYGQTMRLVILPQAFRRRAWAMPAPCGTSIGNWRSAWAWPCSVDCSTCCRRGPTPRPSSTASCSPPLSRYCLCRG